MLAFVKFNVFSLRVSCWTDKGETKPSCATEINKNGSPDGTSKSPCLPGCPGMPVDEKSEIFLMSSFNLFQILGVL